MKIPVGYTEKAIDKAIKQVEEYRKRFQNLIPDFFERCAEKIISLANDRLSTVQISPTILDGIRNGWQTKKLDDKHFVLENTSDKSVYIEFGVGQVGAENPHELAGKEGYEYNVSNTKSGKNTKWSNPYSGETQWYISFRSLDDIDIADTYYEPLTEPKYARRSRKYIRTSGQPATMFAFNAVQDFMDNKMYEPIWKELIKGL